MLRLLVHSNHLACLRQAGSTAAARALRLRSGRLRPEALARSAAGVAYLIHEDGITIHSIDHTIGELRYQVVSELPFQDL